MKICYLNFIAGLSVIDEKFVAFTLCSVADTGTAGDRLTLLNTHYFVCM
jgi:hypothetical protein